MITPHAYATAAIETMFDTKVQRNAVSAFVFVSCLDYTKQLTAKKLQCSVQKVNLLISAVMYYRLNDSEFSDSYDKFMKDLYKFMVDKNVKTYRTEVNRVLTRSKGRNN